MMLDGRAVFAIDVQDDFAVKDVMKPQHRSFGVTDVEPNWETDVVAHEQDVFVAIDVNRLIGCWRKSTGVTEYPSDEEDLKVNLKDVRDSFKLVDVTTSRHAW